MNGDFDLASLRREYDKNDLRKKDLPVEPEDLFMAWFAKAQEQEKDPTAFVLSTSLNDWPNSRVVLLKGLEEGQFVFFTNYHSAKGEELYANNKVAMNFYWPDSERQVRVRGTATKLDENHSDEYFQSRPKESQVGAVVSQQSREMNSREEFEDQIAKTSEEYIDADIDRPIYWGGYAIKPKEYEFWQGRVSRLHDRFLYQKTNGIWKITRLNP